MPIFELTVGKLLELIENFVVSTFGITFAKLKTIIFFFSLIYSLNLFLLLIYYEIKNKDEIGFWLKLKKLYKLFKISQKETKEYEEIKKIYLEDRQKGLISLKNYLNEILEIIGYSGNSINEKIEAISLEDLPNKEELKKAVRIIELIEKKNKFNLSEEEIKLIYSEIEKALYHLNIIEREDFLVKTLE